MYVPIVTAIRLAHYEHLGDDLLDGQAIIIDHDEHMTPDGVIAKAGRENVSVVVSSLLRYV